MKLIKTWKPLKQRTEIVKNRLSKDSKLYNKLDNCSKFITTNVYQNKKDSKNLRVRHKNKFYCHSKFCYVCFEKNMHPYKQGLTMKLNEAVKKGYHIEFLTLTLPNNTKFSQINDTIKKLNGDAKKLIDNLKKNYGLQGSCRRLEISFNDKIYVDDMTNEIRNKIKGIPQTELKKDKKNHKYYFEVLKTKYNNVFECNIHIHLILLYKDKEFAPRFEQLKKLWKKYCNGSIYIKELNPKYNKQQNIKNIVSYMTKPMNFDLVQRNELLILDEQLKKIRLIDKSGELNFSLSEIKKLIKEEQEKEQQELKDSNKWLLVYEYKSVFVTHTYFKTKEKFFINVTDAQKGFLIKKLQEYGEL